MHSISLKSIFLAAILATVFALLSCRPIGVEDSAALTYGQADDFLKVAVNHIGANCQREDHKDHDPTHRLNGANGEVMLEQAAGIDRGSYGFSGDKIMGRTKNNLNTTMEDIEAKCRRLILSVDVGAGQLPSLTFQKGSTVADPAAKFAADFGQNNYGELVCVEEEVEEDEKTTAFCKFANINGKNGKVRYFGFLEPDNGSKTVAATVRITDNLSKKVVGNYPITLAGIERIKPLASEDPGLDPSDTNSLSAILPSAFTAADMEGGGGKGMKPRRREVFATLTVESATLRDNMAHIKLAIKTDKKINKGTLQIKAPANAIFIKNSTNLITTYLVSSGKGTRRVERKHPAGKYGFEKTSAHSIFSIEFKAPIESTDNKVRFSANITRQGFWKSNIRTFEHKGESSIVVRFSDES